VVRKISFFELYLEFQLKFSWSGTFFSQFKNLPYHYPDAPLRSPMRYPFPDVLFPHNIDTDTSYSRSFIRCALLWHDLLLPCPWVDLFGSAQDDSTTPRLLEFFLPHPFSVVPPPPPRRVLGNQFFISLDQPSFFPFFFPIVTLKFRGRGNVFSTSKFFPSGQLSSNVPPEA